MQGSVSFRIQLWKRALTLSSFHITKCKNPNEAPNVQMTHKTFWHSVAMADLDKKKKLTTQSSTFIAETQKKNCNKFPSKNKVYDATIFVV